MKRLKRLLVAVAINVPVIAGITLHGSPLPALAAMSTSGAIQTQSCGTGAITGDNLTAGTTYKLSAINTTSDATEGGSDGALVIYGTDGSVIQSFTDFNVLHTFNYTPSVSGSFSACTTGDGDETGVVSLPFSDCPNSPTASVAVSGPTATFTVTGNNSVLGNQDVLGTPIVPFKLQNIGTILYTPGNLNGLTSIQAAFTKSNPTASASIGFAAFGQHGFGSGFCATLIDPRYNHQPAQKSAASTAAPTTSLVGTVKH